MLTGKKFLFITLLSTLALVGCNENSEFSKLADSSASSSGGASDDSGAAPYENPKDSDPKVIDAPKDPVVTKDPVDTKVPTEPKKPTDPVVDAQPHESTSGSCAEKTCKSSFSVTSIGSNAKVTVVSGSLEKLKNLNSEEFLKLAPEHQAFFISALNNSLEGVSTVTSKSSTVQSASEKLIIRSDEAKVSFNQVEAGVSLHYNLRGKKASFSATGFKSGAKLFAVVDAKEDARVMLNSVGADAEIFLMYVTSGTNVTCVNSTKNAGQLVSVVYGEKDFATEGRLETTAIDREASFKLHVLGDDNTLSSFKATRISSSNINLKTLGGKNTQSLMKFTSMAIQNPLNLIVKGKDNTLLSLVGTETAADSVFNLDIEGMKSSGAKLQITSEKNLSVNGKILAEAPFLSLAGGLKDSKSAVINVALEKK